MINPSVNNQVVIEISDACQSFELDKSVVEIHHNRAKKTKDAAEYLETSLRNVLLFREILWKRAISGGSLEGNHVSDVFD